MRRTDAEKVMPISHARPHCWPRPAFKEAFATCFPIDLRRNFHAKTIRSDRWSEWEGSLWRALECGGRPQSAIVKTWH